MNIQVNTQNIQQNGIANLTPEQLTRELLIGKQELALSAGQILSGQITSREGNLITLLLENHRTLSAELSGNLSIDVGQQLSFEVKSVSGQFTELRPLYTNLTTDSTIENALNDASLPLTERNVSMVRSMMEEGLSVHRQALLDMVSHLNANPEVAPETLVKMQKLQLPMDEISIQQFTHYQNFEHQIIQDVMTMTDGLSALPAELFTGVSEESALEKAIDVLSMALAAEPEAASAMETQGMILAGKEEVAAFTDRFRAMLDHAVDHRNLTPEERDLAAGNFLRSLQTLFEQYRSGTQFPKELTQSLQELMKDSDFQAVLSEKLLKQYLLKPEEVGREGKIEELYQRILEHSNKAMALLENTNNAPVLKSAQNLNANVNFMHQLNAMAAYVQLPLKMSEENAHGDLYVYTNRKKLAERDGNYSALLHLDLEHLGPMDIYVAIQAQKVSTHFYLQDALLLDFIEQHLPLLTERLQKKGYQMNTAVSLREADEMKSMAETFLSPAQGETVPPLRSTLSFDVRA